MYVLTVIERKTRPSGTNIHAIHQIRCQKYVPYTLVQKESHIILWVWIGPVQKTLKIRAKIYTYLKVICLDQLVIIVWFASCKKISKFEENLSKFYKICPPNFDKFFFSFFAGESKIHFLIIEFIYRHLRHYLNVYEAMKMLLCNKSKCKK